MFKNLYVGVDLCEAEFSACFMDGNERNLASRKYPNTFEGFRLFRQDCLAFSRLVGRNASIIIGMESTGNYHVPLQSFLFNRAGRRFKIRVINPYCVKSFRKANFTLCKTDKIDAETIARYLKAFPSQPSNPIPPHQLSLRSNTRFRRVLIQERTRCINRLRKNLRLVLPGYKRVIGDKINTPFLQFLSLHPDFEGIPPSSPYRPLLRILQHDMLSILKDEIKWTAERILQLNGQIEELERKIDEIMDTFYPDHILFSIPGMGKITVATIIGEIGDSVEKFPTQKDFIGYIGLYPTVFQSGKNSVYFRMTWKGNKWLKMAFILATVSARKNNPAFRNFYNRLRDRGKSKKAAGGALARKIACVVYAILRSGMPWNEEYALCGMRRGEQMSQRINEMAGSPNGVNPIRAQRLRDYVGPTRQGRT